MLMGVFIFSILLVGFVCGALFMRYCARRGVGDMSLCNGCRYKNLWAEATAEIAVEELDPQDNDDEEVQRCVKDIYIKDGIV